MTYREEQIILKRIEALEKENELLNKKIEKLETFFNKFN